VARCLAAGADSIALSGGFDSVSLAVLAAGRRGDRTPLHAVSLRFTHDPACDEGETQLAVARALGMPQLVRSLADAIAEGDVIDGALALSAASPSPVLSPWQALYAGLLRSASEAGRHSLMMGTGGDEMFAVDASYGADCLAALDVRALYRFCRAMQRSSPFSAARVARVVLWDEAAAPLLRQGAAAALARVAPGALAALRRGRAARASWAWSLPPDPALRALVDERRREPEPLETAPGERRYATALRRLPRAPYLALEHDQAHAWARRSGFRLLLPYYDRDVVELGLRTHPEDLLAGGRAKAPLRRLVAERLPAVALPPRKRDFTGSADQVLRAGGRRAWDRLGGPRMLADLGVVDPAGVRAMMERYFAGGDGWRGAWLVLSTEHWLRASADRQITSEGTGVGHERG
jgi:asparagine synthetase B (glutamine-hydrolysing)